MFNLSDYEREYGGHYEQASFEPVMVRIRRQRVLQSIGEIRNRRVLEIGCGLDPVANYAIGAQKWVIVEPASRFADAARGSLADRSEVTVINGFFEEIARSVMSEGFDIVVVSSLLHEVEEPARLLRAIRSVCGSETTIHINVPNVRSFHRLLAFEMGLIQDLFERSQTEERFQRKTRFDLQKLQELVGAEGFVVKDSGTYFIKPFTHHQMQTALDVAVIDEKVIEGLSAMIKHLPQMGCEIYVDLQIA